MRGIRGHGHVRTRASEIRGRVERLEREAEQISRGCRHLAKASGPSSGTHSGGERVRWDPPDSFREGHDGSLACRHRDCSCCNECADAYPEIVDVVGAHFWVPTQEERDNLARMMAEDRS